MSALALLSEYDVRDPQEISPTPTVSERETAPDWAEELANCLVAFLHLESGWDSYGAPTPRREAVVAAYELLMMIADPRTPAPQAVPTSRGGVQLEWHEYGIDLEVEVHSAFRFDVFYANSSTGETSEEELMADLTPLRTWIERLSE